MILTSGLAVTIDIGDQDNIHPKDKMDVGGRLAMIALAKTYGRKIEYSGPLYAVFRRGGQHDASSSSPMKAAAWRRKAAGL